MEVKKLPEGLKGVGQIQRLSITSMELKLVNNISTKGRGLLR
jgi:hypothetical protein